MQRDGKREKNRFKYRYTVRPGEMSVEGRFFDQNSIYNKIKIKIANKAH